MRKVSCDYDQYTPVVYNRVLKPGLLLTSRGETGKDNIMTIGWCMIGRIWAKPITIVLVRPSRFTHRLIEETGEYTINVPSAEMAETVDYCGSVSGADIDKFMKKGLVPLKGKEIAVSAIDQCIIHYECKVVYKNRIKRTNLSKEIKSECYHNGNYHTVYYGEILACYANA